MQVKFFNTGNVGAIQKASAGFVIHQVDGASVWFNSEGQILDAERRDSMGRCRQVPRNSERWLQLAKLGPIWRNSKNI